MKNNIGVIMSKYDKKSGKTTRMSSIINLLGDCKIINEKMRDRLSHVFILDIDNVSNINKYKCIDDNTIKIVLIDDIIYDVMTFSNSLNMIAILQKRIKYINNVDIIISINSYDNCFYNKIKKSYCLPHFNINLQKETQCFPHFNMHLQNEKKNYLTKNNKYIFGYYGFPNNRNIEALKDFLKKIRPFSNINILIFGSQWKMHAKPNQYIDIDNNDSFDNIFSKSAVIVIPNLWQSGCSTRAIECIQMKKPFIISNAKSHNLEPIDTFTNCYINTIDNQELVDRLHELDKNPNEIEMLINRCSDVDVTEHLIEETKKKILELVDYTKTDIDLYNKNTIKHHIKNLKRIIKENGIEYAKDYFKNINFEYEIIASADGYDQRMTHTILSNKLVIGVNSSMTIFKDHIDIFIFDDQYANCCDDLMTYIERKEIILGIFACQENSSNLIKKHFDCTLMNQETKCLSDYFVNFFGIEKKILPTIFSEHNAYESALGFICE